MVFDFAIIYPVFKSSNTYIYFSNYIRQLDKFIIFGHVDSNMSSLPLEDFGSISRIPLDIAFRDAIFIGIFSVILFFILVLTVRHSVRIAQSS